MKTAIVFLAVCFLFGYAKSENCLGNDVSTCGHMTCTGTWVLACIHAQCTCVENSPMNTHCTSKAECDALTGWNCHQNRRHCIDNLCKCTRF